MSAVATDSERTTVHDIDEELSKLVRERKTTMSRVHRELIDEQIDKLLELRGIYDAAEA